MNIDNIIIELEKNPDLIEILIGLNSHPSQKSNIDSNISYSYKLIAELIDGKYDYFYKNINNVFILEKLNLINIETVNKQTFKCMMISDLGKLILDQYLLKHYNINLNNLDLLKEFQQYVENKYSCKFEMHSSSVVNFQLITKEDNILIYSIQKTYF
jgi:hypothetical protein